MARYLLPLLLCGFASLVQADAATKVHHITIEAMQFAPAKLEINPGDTVVWHNKDAFPHTATAENKFDSGDIAGGKSWKYKATKKGTYPYVCTLHPGMKAVLTVK